MAYTAYETPEIRWPPLVTPLARAEDRIARLDERVQKSEIREGWRHRTDYVDVIASMWVEGELIHMEDLVLHDAMMDVRAPSHELTKAHALLRLRRRAGAASVDWRNSASAVNDLLGRRQSQTEGLVEETSEPLARAPASEPSDEIDTALDIIDHALLRTDSILARADFPGEVVDESTTERIKTWLAVVEQTATLPPTLAAVITDDAWTTIAPLGHDLGQGRLMAAALLKVCGKTASHLTLWSVGARAVPRAARRDRNPLNRYRDGLDSLVAGAEEGMRQHDTWLTAKRLLERKVRGRRSNSHLPALIDLLIANPIVSASTIAAQLHISQRAALSLIAELDVREITGRGRFRAWGIT